MAQPCHPCPRVAGTAARKEDRKHQGAFPPSHRRKLVFWSSAVRSWGVTCDMSELLNQGHQRHLRFNLFPRWWQEILLVMLQGHRCCRASCVWHGPSLSLRQLWPADKGPKRGRHFPGPVCQPRHLWQGLLSQSELLRGHSDLFHVNICGPNMGQIAKIWLLQIFTTKFFQHTALRLAIWYETGAEVVLGRPSHVGPTVVKQFLWVRPS